VVEVQRDQPLITELALHAKGVAAAVGRGEARINGLRKASWRYDIERERTKRSPVPEAIGLTNGGVSGH
jgi:hypothetical protein